jgi:hypothetical protein
MTVFGCVQPHQKVREEYIPSPLTYRHNRPRRWMGEDSMRRARCTGTSARRSRSKTLMASSCAWPCCFATAMVRPCASPSTTGRSNCCGRVTDDDGHDDDHIYRGGFLHVPVVTVDVGQREKIWDCECSTRYYYICATIGHFSSWGCRPSGTICANGSA